MLTARQPALPAAPGHCSPLKLHITISQTAFWHLCQITSRPIERCICSAGPGPRVCPICTGFVWLCHTAQQWFAVLWCLSDKTQREITVLLQVLFCSFKRVLNRWITNIWFVGGPWSWPGLGSSPGGRPEGLGGDGFGGKCQPRALTGLQVATGDDSQPRVPLQRLPPDGSRCSGKGFQPSSASRKT